MVNRDEFRRTIAAAGLYDHIEEIENCIVGMIMTETRFAPDQIGELREAAVQYLCVCTDYKKLRGFLVECDNLNKSYCLSWDDAVAIVCRIIAGWAP